MVGFVEIAVTAFVAQLLVLPGEKVQFIIAGLATKYHPLMVVSAAGAAFAGWTALEIAFGAVVQGILPKPVLDGLTAILFLAFAILLVRSAPSTDARTMGERTDGGEPASTGSGKMSADSATASTPGDTAPVDGETTPAARETVTIAGREVSLSGRFGTFLPIFAMMAVGEFGDKTQAVTIGLAFQYGATPAIWVGEMLAIIPISLLNAYFFHRIAHEIDLRKAHFAGAAIFVFFGLDTLLAVATGFSVWETIVNAIADVLLSAA